MENCRYDYIIFVDSKIVGVKMKEIKEHKWEKQALIAEEALIKAGFVECDDGYWHHESEFLTANDRLRHLLRNVMPLRKKKKA